MDGEIKKRIFGIGQGDELNKILEQWKKSDPNDYDKNITKINEIRTKYKIGQYTPPL